MDNLTRDEVLSLIIALDNEAIRTDGTEEDAQKYRNLKWKLFNQLVKLEKEAA